MATYKFYLFDNYAENETYVILRMAENKRTYKFYTDLTISPTDWNPKTFEARKTYTGFSDFNKLLTKRRELLKSLHEKHRDEKDFSIDFLRKRFYEIIGKTETVVADKTSFKTLAEFANHYIETVETAKSKNTILHNKQTLRILKEFEVKKKRKYTFDRINLDFYHDFTDYLKTDKKFGVNTVGKHIANIKTFLGEATERGVNTKLDYKSKRFKVTTETVESIYLTEDEILKIYNHDFSKNKRLERTRDLFIVGCYTGLRFSDFSQLTSDNIKGELITVKTQKTGEKVVIPLHWTVKNILAKYSETAKGLPRDLSNQRMNDYLKEIGREVEIDEQIYRTQSKDGLKVSANVSKWELITTHTARRSFATNLYKNGYPTIGIMQITGHRTEKSFMKYIKVSHEENAEKLIQHWQTLNKLRIV